MNSSIQYQNWRVETDKDNILWLYFDRAGRSANSISPAVLDELEQILNKVQNDGSVRAVIFASAKTSGFIAGADIEQFTQFKDSKEAMVFINKGQDLYKRIAALKIPTIAMIKGFCLGGGMELALACRYRIAENSQKTKLGLPEILLGIHPGWGGCVRLPRLIGAIQAMDLILTGRTVTGKAAARLGFVDVAVPERHLKYAAQQYALKPPAPHKATWFQQLTNYPLVRPLLAKKMRTEVHKKALPEHYPAPYAVIDLWEKHGVDEQALTLEAESLGRIAMSDTARNLVRVFFLQDRLKALGKNVEFTAQHVHVVGAGTMGGDIAAWCALRGINVTLQDREPKFIAPAIKRAADLYKKKLKEPRLIRAALDRLMPDPTGTGIGKADVIIEAIYENLEAKQNLFNDLEKRCKPTAVLATNTSSIPLDEINSVLQNPGRLVGIHFFNPVAMMQLVEVVQGQVSTMEFINKATAFVRQIDRLPLPVKSHPGFLVNRVLMPYLMEAMVLLEEGVPAVVIDKAATKFGMPMGPIELADTVGLDVCLAVAKNLGSHFGGTIPVRLEKMVSDKILGKKTGKGFYEYNNGRPIKDNPANYQPSPDIADRMILRMLNEAAACLREQVIADNDLLDAGMIFGTGFAPFRGGPMHYAQTKGINNIITQLKEFTEKYGERFKPDAQWEKIAVNSKNKTDAVEETITS